MFRVKIEFCVVEPFSCFFVCFQEFYWTAIYSSKITRARPAMKPSAAKSLWCDESIVDLTKKSFLSKPVEIRYRDSGMILCATDWKEDPILSKFRKSLDWIRDTQTVIDFPSWPDYLVQLYVHSRQKNMETLILIEISSNNQRFRRSY